MANQEHLTLLKQGVEMWNTWRKRNPETEPDFSGAYLSGLELSEANLREANFNLADLSGANLVEADLRKADLSGANCTGADFSRAYLIRADIVRANLSGADFSRADLIRANLRKADLRKADLSCANLVEADLSGAELAGAFLSGSSLSGTELVEADLSDAVLRKANLSGANLSGANLSRASLLRADLSGANLNRANLMQADLTQTDFRQANLGEANLQAAQAIATNFTQTELTGACIQNWTVNAMTQLESAICDYVYLKNVRQLGYAERCPVDAEVNFAPGELAQRFQKSLETVSLTFNAGIDWKAFFLSFQELRSEYGRDGLIIQAIERKSGHDLVVRLEVPLQVDKAAVAERAHELYESKLETITAQYQAGNQIENKQVVIFRQKSADLTEIVKLLASILIV